MKFERIEESRKPKLVPISREMNELQIELSKELKSLFPEYLNKLNLISSNDTLLTIDSEGNGTFKDYIKSFVIKSAQKELNKGKSLSDLKWITIVNNEVTDVDFGVSIK